MVIAFFVSLYQIVYGDQWLKWNILVLDGFLLGTPCVAILWLTVSQRLSLPGQVLLQFFSLVLCASMLLCSWHLVLDKDAGGALAGMWFWSIGIANVSTVVLVVIASVDSLIARRGKQRDSEECADG